MVIPRPIYSAWSFRPRPTQSRKDSRKTVGFDPFRAYKHMFCTCICQPAAIVLFLDKRPLLSNSRSDRAKKRTNPLPGQSLRSVDHGFLTFMPRWTPSLVFLLSSPYSYTSVWRSRVWILSSELSNTILTFPRLRQGLFVVLRDLSFFPFLSFISIVRAHYARMVNQSTCMY